MTWQSQIYLLYNFTILTTGTVIECQVTLANTSYSQTSRVTYERGKIADILKA